MATNSKRQLTANEEKFLSSLNLTQSQHAEVKDVWENSAQANNWVVSMLHVIDPLLLTGLICLLFFPSQKILHLLLILGWTTYSINTGFRLFALIMSFKYDEMFAKLRYSEIMKSRNIDEVGRLIRVRKAYFIATLNLPVLTVWADSKKILRYFGWLIKITLIVLLAKSAAPTTASFVLVSFIIEIIFCFYINRRTKKLLDEIENPGKV
jgi:hypothetical protein